MHLVDEHWPPSMTTSRPFVDIPVGEVSVAHHCPPSCSFSSVFVWGIISSIRVHQYSSCIDRCLDEPLGMRNACSQESDPIEIAVLDRGHAKTKVWGRRSSASVRRLVHEPSPSAATHRYAQSQAPGFTGMPGRRIVAHKALCPVSACWHKESGWRAKH